MNKSQYMQSLNSDTLKFMKKPLIFMKPKVGRPGSIQIRKLIEIVFNGKHSFVNVAMMYFEPSLSENFGNRKMAIWPDMKSRKQGEKKRMAGKPGRMFKRMFPFATDKQVIEFTDLYLNEFSTNEFELIESFEEDDFVKAYSGEYAETENIYTTYTRKQLAHSCMRGSFSHLTKHPSAVYASGDFKIVYVTSDGLIAGRCVVRVVEDGTDQAGPIYGVTEAAIDHIETHLKEQGAELKDSNWSGAFLQKIPHDDTFVMTYLDVSPRELYDREDFFEITSHGDLCAESDSGVLHNAYTYCYDCGEGLHEDECYSTSDSDIFCEHCFYEHYTCCTRCSEYENNDDAYYVYVGRYEEEVCSGCIDDFTMTSNGEFYENHVVIETEQGRVFNKQNETEFYFESDLTGLYHNIEECRESEEGEYATLEEFENAGYGLNEDHIFIKQEKLELEVA